MMRSRFNRSVFLAAALGVVSFATGCDTTDAEAAVGVVAVTLERADGTPAPPATVLLGARQEECGQTPVDFPFFDFDTIISRPIDTDGARRFTVKLLDVDTNTYRCLLFASGRDRRLPGGVSPLDPSFQPDTVLAIPIQLRLNRPAPYDTVAVRIVVK